MIYENECEDGKASSSKTRIIGLNVFQTSCDGINHETSLDEYMLRSPKFRWLTCKEGMERWKSWDKKQEFINRRSKSRERAEMKLDQ